MGSPGRPPWLSHSPWALVVPCSLLLYVHRDHKDYQGWGAQDGHLDFHTAPGLSPVVCQQNVGPANRQAVFMHCIIIINAFLMRKIPRRLYAWGTFFSMKHYNSTQPNLIMRYVSHSVPCPPLGPHIHMHTHPHTISQPLASPFCSQSLSASHPPKIISQPAKTAAAKS